MLIFTYYLEFKLYIKKPVDSTTINLKKKSA